MRISKRNPYKNQLFSHEFALEAMIDIFSGMFEDGAEEEIHAMLSEQENLATED